MSILHPRDDGTYYQQAPVSLYDTAAVEAWLEDSAREGYRLLRVIPRCGGARGIFQWDLPRECRYRLEPAGESEPDPERVETYRELGWDYVTTYKVFHIWRCDDPAAPELETDPVVQAMGVRLLRRKVLRDMAATAGLLLLWPIVLMRFTTLLELVEGGLPGALVVLAVFLAAGVAQVALEFRMVRRRERSLAAGIPPSHERPYRKQLAAAYILSILLIPAMLIVTNGLTGSSYYFSDPRFAWSACDEERGNLPDPGVVYVDLRVLDGGTEADWSRPALTKVHELAPRMYWTRQRVELSGGGTAYVHSRYYRMLTPGLARRMAEELRRWNNVPKLPLLPVPGGLDALWWGRQAGRDGVPDTQYAVALLDRCVLMVDYQGPTDLRTAGPYLAELLERK